MHTMARHCGHVCLFVVHPSRAKPGLLVPPQTQHPHRPKRTFHLVAYGLNSCSGCLFGSQTVRRYQRLSFNLEPIPQHGARIDLAAVAAEGSEEAVAWAVDALVAAGLAPQVRLENVCLNQEPSLAFSVQGSSMCHTSQWRRGLGGAATSLIQKV